MCRKHLSRFSIFSKRKNNSAARFLLFVLMVCFSFFQTNAQQTQTTQKPTQTKPKSNATPVHTKKDTAQHRTTTTQHRPATANTITSNKKDSTVKKKATPIAVSPKRKDSTASATPRPQHKPIADTSKHTAIVPHANTQKPSGKRTDALWEKTMNVPHLPLKAKPIFVLDEPHPYESKDVLFFTVCGLFLLYGIVRTAFPKYTDSLFRNLVSFSSIDRNDTNMGQNNLPSLLLNILFCLSTSLLAALILEQTNKVELPAWQIWLIGSMVIGAIYLVKFLTIHLSGWIFNATADAQSYMYVVFMVNKIIGILSLPAILIFAFSQNPQLGQYVLTIGAILLVVLLLYRYVVTFSLMARNLQLNAFHFFLYLCSVEIVPILILYKLFFKDLVNWI